MRKELGYLVLAIFFAYLLLGAAQMRPFGNPDHMDMDQYMIDNGQEETAANNIVTSVVFDYRAFDTLGEATVLFTAVAGVISVLRAHNKSSGGSDG